MLSLSSLLLRLNARIYVLTIGTDQNSDNMKTDTECPSDEVEQS